MAVTALTSLPDQTCQRLSGCNRLKLVHRLGSEVQPYLHNYVCSAWEAPVIKKLDPQACVFAPGVRLATTNHDDHHRVMLCSAAKNYGVDYVIVGRPITTAADPVQAFSIVHARFNHLKEEQSRTNISSHD